MNSVTLKQMTKDERRTSVSQKSDANQHKIL